MEPVFEQYYEWMKQFECKIVDFHESTWDGNTENVFYKGFKPFRKGRTELKEDCDYVTIRCGFGGIYSVLNHWKDGRWFAECLDGSETIAYRELHDYEQFKYEENGKE